MSAELTRGAKLRRARLERGWTVEKVASELKLSPKQIYAIEEDNSAVLPKEIYVKGFIRNYARLLERPLSDFDVEFEAPPIEAPLPVAESSGLASRSASFVVATGERLKNSQSEANRRWLIGAILVIMAGILGTIIRAEHIDAIRLFFLGPQTPVVTVPPPSAPVALAPVPESTPTPAADGAPAASPAVKPAPAVSSASGAELGLEAQGDSWIEVKTSDGQMVFSGLLHEGEHRVFKLSSGGSVVIGNAPMVSLSWRGQALDLTPFTHEVVARLTLDSGTP